MLKELEKNMDGYQNSVKTVMRDRYDQGKETEKTEVYGLRKEPAIWLPIQTVPALL